MITKEHSQLIADLQAAELCADLEADYQRGAGKCVLCGCAVNSNDLPPGQHMCCEACVSTI